MNQRPQDLQLEQRAEGHGAETTLCRGVEDARQRVDRLIARPAATGSVAVVQEDDGSGREELGGSLDDHVHTRPGGVEDTTVPSAEAIPQPAESRVQPGASCSVRRAEEADGR